MINEFSKYMRSSKITEYTNVSDHIFAIIDLQLSRNTASKFNCSDKNVYYFNLFLT